jgi:hypothetical protein
MGDNLIHELLPILHSSFHAGPPAFAIIPRQCAHYQRIRTVCSLLSIWPVSAADAAINGMMPSLSVKDEGWLGSPPAPAQHLQLFSASNSSADVLDAPAQVQGASELLPHKMDDPLLAEMQVCMFVLLSLHI